MTKFDLTFNRLGIIQCWRKFIPISCDISFSMHRIDGPAVIFLYRADLDNVRINGFPIPSGGRSRQWWVDGEFERDCLCSKLH